jgi:hypothetical protein
MAGSLPVGMAADRLTPGKIGQPDRAVKGADEEAYRSAVERAVRECGGLKARETEPLNTCPRIVKHLLARVYTRRILVSVSGREPRRRV